MYLVHVMTCSCAFHCIESIFVRADLGRSNGWFKIQEREVPPWSAGWEVKDQGTDLFCPIPGQLPCGRVGACSRTVCEGGSLVRQEDDLQKRKQKELQCW